MGFKGGWNRIRLVEMIEFEIYPISFVQKNYFFRIELCYYLFCHTLKKVDQCTDYLNVYSKERGEWITHISSLFNRAYAINLIERHVVQHSCYQRATRENFSEVYALSISWLKSYSSCRRCNISACFVCSNSGLI